MDTNEHLFDGSVLKTELTNTKNVVAFYKQVSSAYKSFPESKFWKDAFEFIENRYKKTNHENHNK